MSDKCFEMRGNMADMKKYIMHGYIKNIIKVTATIIAMLAVGAASMLTTTAYAEESTTWADNAQGSNVQESNVQADEVKINIVPANKESTSKLKDNSYSTAITFTVDNPLTITPANASDRIYGLYIIWAKQPGEWTLTYDGHTITGGKNAFLHEYIEIPEGTQSAVITLSQNEKICDIRAYSQGELSGDVQQWKPVCDKADMLILSSHADDEILFFGGILPEYAGERELNVQVVYFSNYFGGTVIREHEKLDGLWTAGVRNYPVNADFPDQYADNLEAAKKLFGYEETLSFVVEQIRRFKPQICVAQDTNGEYGHGTHMLTSAAMQEAVTISMDGSKYSESAEKYGVWDVPKTYIHLYKENAIKLDCRKPLSKFDGKTALDVAKEAYKQHVSQQWCWFYVSDTYEYSIADFGLCRTTVGADTGNDMMENITSYAEQKRIEEEKKAAIAASKKAAAEEKAAKEAAKEKAEYELQYGVPAGESSPDKVPNFLKSVGITIVLMIVAAVLILFIGALISRIVYRVRKRRNMRRKNRRRK